MSTAREAVEKAEAANAKAGHENYGSLSISHGFAPRLTPLTRFPEAYKAWDVMGDRVPELISSGRLRKYCDEELPELDGEALPPAYAMRAALVLGYTAHSYWNLGGTKAVKSLPPALEKPWRAVSLMLGRETPFLGFYDLFIHNFMFKDDFVIQSMPSNLEPCPWGSDELKANGSHEYDPSHVTVLNCLPSFTITGNHEEFCFNLVMSEVHCVGAPMVRLVVEAQEAVTSGHIAQLKKCLVALTELLNHIAYAIFARITQVERAQTYVGGPFWAKIIGAVAIPIFSENVGPAPTTAPFIHLFDAFFGRVKHEGFVGKDVVRLSPTLPAHWQTFFRAVRNGPNVGEFVNRCDDTELKGLFGACLRSFAGNEGFLGRHRLKMYGYLEVVMKLGRTMTIAGFGGQFKDRSWDIIMSELKIGQAERFDLPLGVNATRVHKVSIMEQRPEDMDSAWELAHIRINTTGCGIRYRPGSRVGVLWESSEFCVYESLLAFANGNEAYAAELGEKHVVLSDEWRQAIRNRPEYHSATNDHDPIIPSTLTLKTFLKFANLRPVTRAMLQTAYRLCGSQFILQILENNLESTLQFPDVVKLIQQTGVSILEGENSAIMLSANQEIVFNCIDQSPKSGLIEIHELLDACTASGIPIDSTPEVRALLAKYDGKFAEGIDIQEFKDKLGHIFGRVDLCGLLPPADFRVYSVASSPKVNPNEISLYISHVQYEQVSPSAQTTPLLAKLSPLELKYGAGSDYLVRKSMPLAGLAIQAARELASRNKHGRIHLCEKSMMHLVLRGGLSLDQAQDVFDDYLTLKTMSDSREKDLYHISEAIDMNVKGAPPSAMREVVLFHFEPPRFKLPTENVPIVMIAGGTGVAPFRGFWQERASRHQFACDHRDLVILQMRSRAEIPSYLGLELASLVRSGKLDVEIMLSQEDFTPCFNKGGFLLWKHSPGRKGYISSLIKGPLKEKIASLVQDRGAHLYVCGRGRVAKTALDALDETLSVMYGEEQDVVQRMVATERVSLEVFSSNNPVPVDVEHMNLSYVCTCNNFVGNRSSGNDNTQLLIVIEGEVYDVTSFLDLHPGGAPIMHLYCGMDASKAWKGVEHDKAPEILGMLEMYTTGKRMSTQNVANSLGAGALRFWYTRGWVAMADVLVEAQNILALSYQGIWDLQAFTSAEEKDYPHWCVWNGKAVLHKKKSIFKGHRFLEIHQRLWLSFLPILLGEEFQVIIGGGPKEFLSRGDASLSIRPSIVMRKSPDVRRSNNIILDQLKVSPDHDACDVFSSLLEDNINAEASTSEGGNLSSELQALMEEVRVIDEALLENMKTGVIMGLVGFEEAASSSGVNDDLTVADVGNGPNLGVQVLLNSLKGYVEKLALLTSKAFGEARLEDKKRLLEVNSENQLTRGGLHLVGDKKLENDFVKRHLVDTKDEITVKFGEDARAHAPHAKSKCPFH